MAVFLLSIISKKDLLKVQPFTDRFVRECNHLRIDLLQVNKANYQINDTKSSKTGNSTKVKTLKKPVVMRFSEHRKRTPTLYQNQCSYVAKHYTFDTMTPFDNIGCRNSRENCQGVSNVATP